MLLVDEKLAQVAVPDRRQVGRLGQGLPPSYRDRRGTRALVRNVGNNKQVKLQTITCRHSE